MDTSCECSDSDQEFERLEQDAGGHHTHEQRGSPGHDDYNRLMTQVRQQEQQLYSSPSPVQRSRSHTPQATSCECSDSDQEFERLEQDAGGHHTHEQRGSPGHDDYNRLMTQVRQQEQQLYSSPSPVQRSRSHTPQATSCECSDSDLDEFERLERETGGHHHHEHHRSPTGQDDHRRLMEQVRQQEQQLYSSPPPSQRSSPHTPQGTSCACADPELEEFERLERETGGHHHNRHRRSPRGQDDHRRLMEQVRQQEQQLYSSSPPPQRSRPHTPQGMSGACADPELEEFERLERETGGHHHHRHRRSPTGQDDHRRLMEQVRQQEQQLYSSPPPSQRSSPHTPQGTSCACADPELEEFERLERESGGLHPHRHRRSPTGQDDHRRLREQVRQQEQQLYSSPPPSQRSSPHTPQGTSCACADPELEEFERLERESGGHHPHRHRRSPTGQDDHRRLREQVRQQEQQLYSSSPPPQRSRPHTPQGMSGACADPELEEFERHEREIGGRHHRHHHHGRPMSPTGHDDQRRLMEQVRQQEQQLYSVPPPAQRPQRHTQQHPRSSSLPRRVRTQHDARTPQPSRSQSRIPGPTRDAPQSSRTPRYAPRTPEPLCHCPRMPGPHHPHHHHDAGRSGIPQPTRPRRREAPPPRRDLSRVPCPTRSFATPRTTGRSTGAVPRRHHGEPQTPVTPVNILNVRPADAELEAELNAALLRASRRPSLTMGMMLERWAPAARQPTPPGLRRPIQIPLTSSQRHILDEYQPTVSPIDEGVVGEERWMEGPSPPHISQETIEFPPSPPMLDDREPPAHRSRTPSPQTCWSPGQRERLYGPREQLQFHSPLQAAGRYQPPGSPIDEREERWMEGPSPPHISQETIEFPPSPPMLDDEWEPPAHRSRTPSPQTCWSPGQRERLYGPREQLQFHSPLQAAGRYQPPGSPIDEREERWMEGPSPPHISQETIEFPPSPPMLDDERETSGHHHHHHHSKSPCSCQ